MDGPGQTSNAAPAGNSSDFVSFVISSFKIYIMLIYRSDLGAQAIQVRVPVPVASAWTPLVSSPLMRDPKKTNLAIRMLEDPSYASIVRWGDEGDSFVVLEVNAPVLPAGGSRTEELTVASARNSPKPSCRNTSSIATLPVLCANSTNTISTRFAKIMKRMVNRHMVRMYVLRREMDTLHHDTLEGRSDKRN